jgi:hypothetical protein
VTENMSRKPGLLLILAVVLMASAATACQSAPATPVNTDTERYAVYSAVIADLGSLPVVGDRVGGLSWKDSDYDRVHAAVGGIDRPIWDNLREANLQPGILQNHFDPGLGEVPLVSWADLGIIFSKNQPVVAWEIFHQKYPGKCLLNVSNVGFNDQVDKAILYTSYVCDEKSGGGKIVYLTRQGHAWIVRDKATLWGA